MTGKRIYPPTYLLIAIALMLALHFLYPVATAIPKPWTLLGSVTLATGVILDVVAANLFRAVQTTIKPFEAPSRLVTGSVFRLSRNPMCLGFVFILIGFAILLGSVSPYGVVVAFVILIERVFIQAEEKMLEARFGSTWQAYKAKVRRWL